MISIQEGVSWQITYAIHDLECLTIITKMLLLKYMGKQSYVPKKNSKWKNYNSLVVIVQLVKFDCSKTDLDLWGGGSFSHTAL